MPSKPYASGTYVPIGRSKEQIESELRRLGAAKRAFYDDEESGQAIVVFERAALRYRLHLPLPNPSERVYHWINVNRTHERERTPLEARSAWEQDVKERWRALAEYVKSLRIAHEAGIIKVEEALLHAVVLPGGQTVGEWTLPQLPDVYAGHPLPPLLPGPTARAPALPPPPQARIEESRE